MKPFSAWAAIAAVASSIASASALQYCPTSGLCFTIAIPTSSASSNSGPIFFQISAPTSYQWAALGTGSGMNGANMFIMYQDGSGNVTISPRIGHGHNYPNLDTSSTAAKLTLLAGSGVNSTTGTMVANIRCDNCQSWTGGGSMSLTSSTSGWIAAWKSGGSFSSSSQSVGINAHDNGVTFRIDLTKATVSGTGNPFTNTTTGSSSSGSGSGSGGTSDSSGVTVLATTGEGDKRVVVHGWIMGGIFAVLYPVGSALMPMLGKWLWHAVFQMILFVLMWVGFVLGILIARDNNILFKQPHTIMGVIVPALLILQPVLGWFHHQYFVKHGTKSVLSPLHIWYGRVLILVGVFTGWQGLVLTSVSNTTAIVYTVVGVVLLVLSIAVKAFIWQRKNRTMRNKNGMLVISGPGSPEEGASLRGEAYELREGQAPKWAPTPRRFA